MLKYSNRLTNMQINSLCNNDIGTSHGYSTQTLWWKALVACNITFSYFNQSLTTEWIYKLQVSCLQLSLLTQKQTKYMCYESNLIWIFSLSQPSTVICIVGYVNWRTMSLPTLYRMLLYVTWFKCDSFIIQKCYRHYYFVQHWPVKTTMSGWYCNYFLRTGINNNQQS